MPQAPVFYDPDGKRRKVVSSGGRVAGLLIGVVSTIFFISLLSVSLTQVSAVGRKTHLIPKVERPDTPSGLVAGQYRDSLVKDVLASKSKANPVPKAAQRIIGFYNLEDSGYESLKNHITALTHLMPQWLKITKEGDQLDTEDLDKEINLSTIKALCGSNHVRLEPIITNWVENYDNPDNSGFSDAAAHNLLANRAHITHVAQQIVAKVVFQHFDGVNVDIEEVAPEDRANFVVFLRTLRSGLSAVGKELSVDLQTEAGPEWQGKYAAESDFAVFMAYDEHFEGSGPGPIASWHWVQQNLKAALQYIPRQKLVLGMGAYTLDWHRGVAGRAEKRTYQESLMDAKGYLDAVTPDKAIQFDPASLNSYYVYDDDNNVTHEAWVQDVASTYNSWAIGRALGLTGFSLWALGQEDPSIWTFFDRSVSTSPDPVAAFARLGFPGGDVDNIGKGDLLTVKSHQSEGSRKLKVDSGTGLVNSLVYESYPSPTVIEHHGYKPKKVVLTFDDGPDPLYTPRILDILKQENVKATFFMIGQNMEQNSRLVQRVYDEGHVIGSHTFFHPDLGLVSDRRVLLELNATQRSVESIVGRMTSILRPPYNADRDPATDQEVRPIVIADNLGYVIVGETADPNDWAQQRVDPVTDVQSPRTVQNIIDDTLTQVKAFDHPETSNRDAGNCILLHDAGGDREKTVLALPGIIHTLRANGYEIVNLPDLISTPTHQATRDDLMPPVPDRDRYMILLDRVTFTTIFTFLQLLAIAFVTAIALGILRVLFVAPLAVLYERRQSKRTYSADFRPPVSVMIAAYNEERVIVRTIQSILTSDYPISEVIVVNDGSADATGAAVEEAFTDEPRVRLINQENAGKAEALNTAMHAAQNDLLISVDADTQLLPESISLLVRHFEDPEVGAVAGNVQVGNMHNIVTTWQGIEYTTSQNMDRRAYGYLKCITVVPGAIGGWRKEAVEAVGGHQNDTLAEDMDLTWRLRLAGWKQETESDSFAYTEAPETIKTFFRQRFRWAYGTLQCLVKHRRALFKNGFFGWFALPSIWLFQIVFQAIAPLVDLQIVISFIGFLLALSFGGSKEESPIAQSVANLREAGLLYLIFFGIEFLSALLAYRMEKKRLGSLWWLFLQRFAYRQIMYAVIYKSLITAVKGARTGWGKLDRTARVKL